MSIPINDQRCCNCAYWDDDRVCTLWYPREGKNWLDWCLKWKDYAEPVDILDICFELESEGINKEAEIDIEILRSQECLKRH